MLYNTNFQKKNQFLTPLFPAFFRNTHPQIILNGLSVFLDSISFFHFHMNSLQSSFSSQHFASPKWFLSELWMLFTSSKLLVSFQNGEFKIISITCPILLLYYAFLDLKIFLIFLIFWDLCDCQDKWSSSHCLSLWNVLSNSLGVLLQYMCVLFKFNLLKENDVLFFILL
jgi:hypothetical protein